jgi:hypothetical protein
LTYYSDTLLTCYSDTLLTYYINTLLTCYIDTLLTSYIDTARYSDTVEIVDMVEGKAHTVSLPVRINDLFMASPYDWLITETETNS